MFVLNVKKCGYGEIVDEFPPLSFLDLSAEDSAFCRLILETFPSHYRSTAASSL